jgi:small-conductance mechanosensitive channel
MILGLSDRDAAVLLFNLLRAAAILIAGLLIARLVRGWILRLGMHKRIAVNMAALLGNLAQIGIGFLAVIMVLPTFGVDWTGLLTLIGTIGLAISLAFQDLLKNIIAGIYMLIERPFQIGDVITVERGSPVTGTVQTIELRVTTLRTPEGVQVIVPNSTIFGEILTNRSAFNLQRDIISVTITLQEHTLSSLTSKIAEVLEAIPQVCKSPAPATRVENISGDKLKLHVEFWTAPENEGQTSGVVALALREALPAAEVTVVS